MIRVLIADDHALIREGIRKMLDRESDMEVVADATDGEKLLDEVRRHHPDVVRQAAGDRFQHLEPGRIDAVVVGQQDAPVAQRLSHGRRRPQEPRSRCHPCRGAMLLV